MARFGEGDQRWIVQERADGQNVGNWHWCEKDIMEWCKYRLDQLYSGMELLPSSEPMSASCTGLSSVTGEAFCNIRKGKVIPAYELEIKVGWKGFVKDGEGNVVSETNGVILYPYVAEENHDEDPEFRVVLSTDSSVSSADQRLKDTISKRCKELLLKTIKQFVKECHAGGPVKIVKGDGAAAATAAESKPAPAPTAAAAPKPAAAPAAASAPKPQSGSAVSKGDKGDSITIREKFRCRPQDLFECLTDQGRVMAFSRAPAQVIREPGAPFMMYGGSITGQMVKLEPGKLIEQQWRFNTWPEGCHSTLKITFEEPEHGETWLILTQTGIPHQDKYGHNDVAQTTSKGWMDMVLTRIHQVFGF